MNIPALSVKNPIAIIMFFAALMLLGIISFFRLDLELFPNISFPQLSITTTYEGASPEEIMTLLSMPIEETIGTVSGVKKMESFSSEGKSTVVVAFEWGTNMDFAVLRVREKLDFMLNVIPREATFPVITKYNPFAQASISLVVSHVSDLSKINNIVQKRIKDRLSKIDGVATVKIEGGIEEEVSVQVNPKRLEAAGYDLLKVIDAIKNANLDYPAGSIKDNYYEYLLRVTGKFKNLDDIANVPIYFDQNEIPRKNKAPLELHQKEYRKTASEERYENINAKISGNLIYLKDISDVEYAYKDRESYSRYNSNDCVTVHIYKQSDVNAITMSKNLVKELPVLKKILGKNFKIDIVYNEAEFIKNAISSVLYAGVSGAVLAFLVLLLFLRNFRIAAIVLVVIPVSVAATFLFMFAFNVSLNCMSLGGLVLAIGMLVDNSIVVIENIIRIQQQESNLTNAVIKGTKEVFTAIIASTLTSIAVFIPVLFATGIVSQLFKELAITVSCSLLVSLLLSISLTPVLFLTFYSEQKSSFNEIISGLLRYFVFRNDFKKISRLLSLESIQNNFSQIVRKVITLCVVLVFVCFGALIMIDKNLLPRVDKKEIFINVKTSQGTALTKTNKAVLIIEKILEQEKTPKTVLTTVGSNNKKNADVNSLSKNEAELHVILKNTKASTNKFLKKIKTEIQKHADLDSVEITYVVANNILSSFEAQAAAIKIMITSSDFSVLPLASNWLKNKLRQLRGLENIQTSVEDGGFETRVSVLRDQALLLGLHVDEVAMLARAAIHGAVASELWKANNKIDITVKALQSDIDKSTLVDNLKIYSPTLNTHVALKQIADTSEEKGVSEIYRLNGISTSILTGDYTNRHSSKQGLAVQRVIQKAQEKFTNCDFNSTGESFEMQKAFLMLLFMLLLSIVIIYAVMAAEFKSYFDPLIILSVIPFSLMGVVLTLLFTGNSLTVIAALAGVMLCGIVVNNGIVLLTFVKQNTGQEQEPLIAFYNAIKIRLRPICMTTATTVLGLLPLSLGFGKGAELGSPIAISVLGGLVFSLGITLVVMPVVYVSVIKRVGVSG